MSAQVFFEFTLLAAVYDTYRILHECLSFIEFTLLAAVNDT